MNERIRELAKQSGIDLPDDSVYNGHIYKNAIERFAELIVQECIQTLLDNTSSEYTNEVAEEDWDRGYDRAMKDCVHHIKEHFEVRNSKREQFDKAIREVFKDGADLSGKETP